MVYVGWSKKVLIYCILYLWVCLQDRTELELQTRRQIYIQYCMYKELNYLHKQQGFVSVMYQSFVNDQIKYSQLSLNNWKSLEDPVYQMPAELQWSPFPGCHYFNLTPAIYLFTSTHDTFIFPLSYHS